MFPKCQKCLQLILDIYFVFEISQQNFDLMMSSFIYFRAKPRREQSYFGRWFRWRGRGRVRGRSIFLALDLEYITLGFVRILAAAHLVIILIPPIFSSLPLFLNIELSFSSISLSITALGRADRGQSRLYYFYSPQTYTW